MSTYITYQCSVCRRTKDILKDNNRSNPNLCIITKGCSGRIFPILEKSFSDATIPVTGLTDWFPKGKSTEAEVKEDSFSSVDLSTSDIGTLTLAIKGVQQNKINLKVLERKIEDVDFQQYTFKLTEPSNSVPFIGGSTKRDIYGKLLSFNQQVIDDGRIMVIVNGVTRFVGTALDDIASIVPNSITFNKILPEGTIVSVLIYTEKDTLDKTISFTLNSTKMSRYGPWSNVAAVRDLNFKSGSIADAWYTYTCESISTILPNSRLKVLSINDTSGNVLKSPSNLSDVRFLLSTEPYSSVDRYYNFVVNAQKLNESFSTFSTGAGIIKLSVDSFVVSEIFPPLKIYPSDFLSDDLASSQSILSEVTRLSSNKILGPI